MEGAQIASPLLTASIQYVINVLLTLPAIIFLDRWGRRPPLVLGAFGMMTWLFISGKSPSPSHPLPPPPVPLLRQSGETDFLTGSLCRRPPAALRRAQHGGDADASERGHLLDRQQQARRLKGRRRVLVPVRRDVCDELGADVVDVPRRDLPE